MASLVDTVDTAHDDMIHDAQVDYYGTMLATCSSDRRVKIFDVRTGSQKLICELKGHEGPVWQVAWSHPMFGSILASCSYDRKVILWKGGEMGWANSYEYANHDSSVNSISWAPHEFGMMLACGSSDGTVSVLTYTDSWNFKKINNVHTIGCNAVSWAPAIAPNSLLEGSQQQSAPLIKRFVTGGCDNLVKIWKYSEETEQWIEEHKLEAHNDWVRDVAWAPSLGLSHSVVASCSQDRRVIIWTNNGVDNAWSFKELPLFDDVVWHVSWSVTGNILAVSGGDNKVTLWKESLDGNWICISDIKKGQGSVSTTTNSERTL